MTRISLYGGTGRPAHALGLQSWPPAPSHARLGRGGEVRGPVSAAARSSVTGNYSVSKWVNALARLGSLTVSLMPCGLFNPPCQAVGLSASLPPSLPPSLAETVAVKLCFRAQITAVVDGRRVVHIQHLPGEEQLTPAGR